MLVLLFVFCLFRAPKSIDVGHFSMGCPLMFLIFIFDLFSCRCGDFFMCEGAIEGVVEMSFF